MPFSGASDPKLPDRIQKMPAPKRRAFVGAFNSTFEACMSGGGNTETCEGRAFASGNAAANSASGKIADGEEQFSGSSFVGIVLGEEVGKQLMIPNGLEANDLHITLAHIPSIAASHLGAAQLAMQHVAARFSPMEANINGLGRFQNGDAATVFAIPDIAELGFLRAEVVSELLRSGVPVSTDHGFMPHISLLHGQANMPWPLMGVPNLEFVIDKVSLIWGDNMMLDHQLSAPPFDDDPFFRAIAPEQIEAKIGRVISRSNAALVQQLHDNASALGATCTAMPLGEDDKVHDRDRKKPKKNLEIWRELEDGPYANLNLAPNDYEFDPVEALKRVADFFEGEFDLIGKCFMIEQNGEVTLDDYPINLLFTDVIKDELMVIPSVLQKIASSVKEYGNVGDSPKEE